MTRIFSIMLIERSFLGFNPLSVRVTDRMITYRIGDAANPRPPAVIAHVVNDIGFFGAGFSGAIERRHPWAALHYRAWCAAKLGAPYCARGQCLISLHDSIAVAHLCAMNGVRRQGHTRPLVLASLDAAQIGRAS